MYVAHLRYTLPYYVTYGFAPCDGGSLYPHNGARGVAPWEYLGGTLVEVQHMDQLVCIRAVIMRDTT